jgi:hypothetical protein
MKKKIDPTTYPPHATVHEWTPTLIHMEFNSWSDLLADTVGTEQVKWNDSRPSSEKKKESGFNSGSWTECKRRAAKGWPEGLKTFTEALDVAKTLNDPTPLPSHSHDVAGQRPDVPLYCAGDPAHMIHTTHHEQGRRPAITFNIAIGAHAGVTPKQMANQGAALVAIIDQLEADGQSVHINAVRVTTDIYREPKPQAFMAVVPIKRADEPFDLDRAAFILAYPDTLRRVMFRLHEMITHDDHQQHWSGMGGNGDAGNAAFAALAEPGDINIPRIGTEANPERAHSTMAKSLAQVHKMIDAATA